MSSKSDFLKTAILSLSPERFSEAVAIFERSYLANEVVSVDGHDDGGCDIKIYKNRREQKRCVQVTVNKNVKNKLYDDLVKVDQLISKYGYSSTFDFFCSVSLSDDKINEYKAYANKTYCVELNIYDGNRLSQLDCHPLEDYLYSLVKPDTISFSLDKATKLLYQMLASGKNTSGIKQSILNSIIVSILFERGALSVSELKSELFERANINVPNILDSIQDLNEDGRVTYDRNSGIICLTDFERECVKDIIATSTIIEEEFLSSFREIFNRYGVQDQQVLRLVLEDIKCLYKSIYNSDIDGLSGFSQKDVIEDFKNNLQKRIPIVSAIEDLYDEIKVLCENNSYLNRIIASESFLSLYKSNKLEQYLNHKKKVIFLDTPAIVYLLLSKFSDRVIKEWSDPDYNSMCCLINLCNQNPNRLELCVYREYLYEVSWEIRKALQLSWLDTCSFTESLGETSNNFYNFYHYMREKDLFEIDEEIDSLEDLIYAMGIDDTDVNSTYFMQDTVKDLDSILQDYGITVVDRERFDCFTECKIFYERQLLLHGKNKTSNAISNDVSQMLYLLTDNANENEEDLFLSTWDTSLFDLRDGLIKMDDKGHFSFFHICNPARLSNRIALELFNIDQSAITNDVFLYADKEYDISKKIKSLRDLIAPILGRKGNANSKLIRNLNSIKKEQIQSSEKEQNQEKKSIHPVEDVLLLMMKSTDTSNKEYLQKFIAFANNESNNDYIIKVVEEGVVALTHNVSYDLRSFYSAVESGVIPESFS